MANALVVTDVQNDFCESGSLAVGGGAAVAAAITDHIRTHHYDHIVATRDYHLDPGAHFATNPDYVDSWPPHCVQGTAGADFHADLDTALFEAIFDKGERAAAYSGFEGRTTTGDSLADWLRAHDVDTVEIVGIATDHCIRATALDATRAGFKTTVLLDLTAGVASQTTTAALEQMQQAGVTLRGQPVVQD